MNVTIQHQLHGLEKLRTQLEKLIKNGRFKQVSFKKRQQWRLKIERLKKQLSNYVHFKTVKKAITGATVVISLAFGSTANAQTFNAPLINPFGLTSNPESPFLSVGDLDGDGDPDIMLIDNLAGMPGSIIYKNNIGTASNPNFITAASPFTVAPVIIPLAIPALVDIDGDGDLDLFITDYGNGLKYYENVGTPSSPMFSSAVNTPFGINRPTTSTFMGLSFADMDGDSDLDLIIGGDGYYGDLVYFENIGNITSPSFTQGVINPFGMQPVNSYYAFPSMVDIDNDGDNDLMVSGYYSELFYYENTGTATNPIFGTSVSNPFNLNLQTVSPYASGIVFNDFDGDFDIDLIVSTYFLSDIIFYENGVSTQNTPPTSGNKSVTMNQRDTLCFHHSMFAFNSVNAGQTLNKIKITSLPSNGVLKVLGANITLNQEINVIDLNSMVYIPNAISFISINQDNFQFKVSDGSHFSSNYTFFISLQNELSNVPVSVLRSGNGLNNEIEASITVDNIEVIKPTLSPNPASETVNIFIETAAVTEGLLTIQNISGQVVLSQNIKLNGDFNTSIDVQKFNKGVYFIKLQTTDGQYWTEKLILE